MYRRRISDDGSRVTPRHNRAAVPHPNRPRTKSQVAAHSNAAPPARNSSDAEAAVARHHTATNYSSSDFFVIPSKARNLSGSESHERARKKRDSSARSVPRNDKIARLFAKL